jgi:hypothetical protein
MSMKYFLILFSIFSLILAHAGTEKKYTQEEYVTMWKSVAVSQMVKNRIPASIIMAQGILESGNGNSILARTANNHFGIKCHEWTGETIYLDDDKPNECFRSYATADESFMDHSKFLMGRARYTTLFKLQADDYKGWAQGLKDAGYATNPKYPQLLIDLIDKLKLYELDKVGNTEPAKVELMASSKESKAESHLVKVHKNKIKYVIAKKGDTFYRIAKEFDMGLWQLYKYNDFGERKDMLQEGDIIYLQPKRRKSKSNDTFEVKNPISLRTISQLEGIRLESLMDKNSISSPDDLVPKGKEITLK